MESIRELRIICQSARQDSMYGAIFLRRFSIYFTWILLRTPVSANQISLLMILIGIVAGGFLALGGYTNGLIGVLSLHLYLMLDCVDGEIASYKNQRSLKGKYLDLISNDIVHVAMFLGLTIGMFNGSYKIPAMFLLHYNIILLCGLGAIVSPLLYKLAVYYVNEVRGESIVLSNLLLTGKKGMPFKILLGILRPVSVINILTISAFFNLLPFVLTGYGIIFPLWYILSTILRFKEI